MTTIKTLSIDNDVERLIIVSDLHGFTEPLKEVDEILDRCKEKVQVLAAGDYLAMGPYPAESLAWVRDRAGAFAVLGNHEEGTLAAQEDDSAPPFTEAGALHRLDSGLREYLAGLPHIVDASWRGKRVRMTHDVTPTGEKFSWTARPAEVVPVMADPDVDLAICGHTHFPFVRRTGKTIVANSGSVSALMLGLKSPDGSVTSKSDEDPFVAAPRIFSSYLSVVIRNGDLDVTVERFEYDVEAAVQQLRDARHPRIEDFTSWLRTGVYQHSAD